MKTLAVAGLAGLLAIVVLAAYGGMDRTASRDLSKRNVADDAGNLHVPDTYRTTYELLGSWAVAADQGQGSKQAPRRLCIARDHRRLSHGRTFPRRRGARKGGV
jgi:hypothetical protein